MRGNMGLYRGKRVDNGEWVEGYLIRNINGQTFIVQYITIYTFDGKVIIEANHSLIHKVLPETVGMWTGLYDLNHKKIWEHDIIGDGDDKEIFGVIVWDSENSRFAVKFDSGIDKSRMSITDWFEHWRYRYWQVLGNIHDNPELIEDNNQ